MLRVVFLAGVFLLASFANAEKWEGQVKMSSNGLAFLGKFCYDYDHDGGNAKVGGLDLTIQTREYTTGLDNTYWLLYDDEDTSWPEVFPNRDHMSCEEIVKKSKNDQDNSKAEDFQLTWVKKGDTWHATLRGKEIIQHQIEQKMRPRWWFITLVNCDETLKGASYTMHAYQKQGPSFDREFGINEAGLNTLNLVFFFYYFFFLIIHSIGTRRLSQQLEYTHPLVRLFYIIIVLQFLVVVARMLHYGIFAQNGWGVPELQKFAEVTEIFVRVGFLIILMLLAKGWTINPGEISGRKYILLFSFLFLFAEVAILFWKYAVEDPAATSPEFGLAFMLYTLMGFWFVWSFWFARVIFSSWRTEENPVKKSLFFKLAVVYFPWFFGLPFITFLEFALDPWVREKTVASVSLLISTAAYTFLAWLLWPTRAEEYFSISASDTMTSGVDNYEQL